MVRAPAARSREPFTDRSNVWLDVTVHALLPCRWITCHVQCGNYRNVILRCDKEHGIGKTVQQRSSCLSTNPLEAKWLTLDVRNAA
jgi:hypothetical protein